MRYAAVYALGQIGDPRAVQPILATLRLLVNPVDLARDDLAFEQSVGLLLPRLGPSVVPALSAAAEDEAEHRGVRGWAIEALGHLGGRDAADALLRLDARGDAALATAVTMAMGNFIDARFRAPLLAALAATGAPTRRALAVQGLDHQGGPDVGDLLLKLLQDEDRYVRKNAAYGLGEHGDARALPALLQLREQDPNNRREIDQALAQLRERHR